MERWLVDLVRVGASGNASGVVQLGRRLIRTTPSGVTNVEAFRAEVGRCLVTASQRPHARGADLASSSTGESDLPILTNTPIPAAEAPVLDPAVEGALERIFVERSQLEKLADAGLEPASRLLLTGPPGVGKTMIAEFLAARLGVPLLRLDLAAVMSSLLGQSGQNLNRAFQFAQESNGILFLDEFDAVAKYRDDKTDLGELKRLVNIILLAMDQWNHSTLLVAATNHPELLDRAVSRRFDVVLSLSLPGENERREIIADRASRYSDVASWPNGGLDVLAALTEGLSGSDIHRLSQSSARNQVLEDRPYFECIFESVLQQANEASTGALTGSLREVACYAAADLLGWSNRRTAAALGVSHPTVGKALASYRQKGGRDSARGT